MLRHISEAIRDSLELHGLQPRTTGDILMSEHDGGPAYPAWSTKEPFFIQGGMTLRDYFAAAALANMKLPHNYETGPCNASAAERAYALADAMLRERERKPL
jgi:hypothetical protein